ncbi:hypothetical protein DVH24_011099 [Malus domestica]|uniref:LRR receptor-like serine/threonine-protein kinase n=1 Tax=Malus domestica TaxID=3750 RepID=A0A498JYA3_MALDO|nr:hypothetical protein DVH24_011099 [Malus domestica]
MGGGTGTISTEQGGELILKETNENGLKILSFNVKDKIKVRAVEESKVLHMYNMKMKLLMRILLLCFWFQLSFSQNATTDPSEVRALNSIFEQWDTKAVQGQWNISGEPCSGSAINGTNIESPDINPALVCNCSYDNNATCHITKLSVYSPKKRGVFPEEFVALRYLTFLYEFFPTPFAVFVSSKSYMGY